jgi:predicted amidohydrolase YtcJ
MKPRLAILLCLITNTLFAQPDFILYNGKVFTSDKRALWEEAVAIKGNRIIAVGKSEVVRKQKGRTTKLIDLQGHLVIPGLNDAHAHIGPDYPSRVLNLSKNPADPTPWPMIQDSIVRTVRELPPGTMITGSINPDLFEDTEARRAALDILAPDHPVVLAAWTGHGMIVNTSAMKLLNLKEESEFAGGRIEKDNNGRSTGFLEEYAGFHLSATLTSKLSQAAAIKELQRFHEYTASLGITSLQNMCTSFGPAAAIQMYEGHFFSCRTRLIAFPVPDSRELRLAEWKPLFNFNSKLTYGSGIKMILDGTPIERLACMRKPYSDKNTYGRLNFTPNQLKAFMTFALENKQQIMIHAVGDSAIATIIKTMRDLHPDAFWRDKRVRLEHAEMAVVDKQDLQSLKDLGIIIVQNPLHLTLPDIMGSRLDSSRTHYLQAMRSLLDNKIHFALGSDGPINPFLNLMFATIHPDNPREALTLEDALIAYTAGSAFAEFKEREKGMIVRGQLADLAVLSQDIFEIPREQMPATQSILTFLDGQIVFDKKMLR